MLTHKQKWRKVRRASRKSASATGGDSAAAADAATTGGGVPNPINSLSIGDSLLQLLGMKARSCNEEGAPSKDAKAIRGAGAYCPVGGAVPVGTYSIGKVSFNQRVRVVLIPTRPELASIKGDLWWEDHDYAYFRREYVIFVRATGSPAPDTPPSPPDPAAAEHTDATPQPEGNDEPSSERVVVTVGADMKGDDDGESLSSPANLPFPQPSSNTSGKDASIMLDDTVKAAASGGNGVCDTASVALASPLQPSLTHHHQQQCHPVDALGVLTGRGVTLSGSVLVGGAGVVAFPQEEKAFEGQDVEEEEKDGDTKQIRTGRPPLSPHGALLHPSTTTMFGPACGGGVTSRSQSLSSISDQTDPESFSGGSDCDDDRDDGRDGSC